MTGGTQENLHPQQVRVFAKDFIKKYQLNLELRFIKRGDLVANKLSLNTLGLFAEKLNTIFIVEDNVKNFKELNQLLRHEVFGHYAISCLNDEERLRLYVNTAKAILEDQDIREQYEQHVLKDYATNLFKHESEASQTEINFNNAFDYFLRNDRLEEILYPRLIEELYARFAETNTKVSYSKKLLQRIKTLFSDAVNKFVGEPKLTLQEIKKTVEGFETNILSGKLTPNVLKSDPNRFNKLFSSKFFNDDVSLKGELANEDIRKIDPTNKTIKKTIRQKPTKPTM